MWWQKKKQKKKTPACHPLNINRVWKLLLFEVPMIAVVWTGMYVTSYRILWPELVILWHILLIMLTEKGLLCITLSVSKGKTLAGWGDSSKVALREMMPKVRLFCFVLLVWIGLVSLNKPFKFQSFQPYRHDKQKLTSIKNTHIKVTDHYLWSLPKSQCLCASLSGLRNRHAHSNNCVVRELLLFHFHLTPKLAWQLTHQGKTFYMKPHICNVNISQKSTGYMHKNKSDYFGAPAFWTDKDTSVWRLEGRLSNRLSVSFNSETIETLWTLILVHCEFLWQTVDEVVDIMCF